MGCGRHAAYNNKQPAPPLGSLVQQELHGHAGHLWQVLNHQPLVEGLLEALSHELKDAAHLHGVAGQRRQRRQLGEQQEPRPLSKSSSGGGGAARVGVPRTGARQGCTHTAAPTHAVGAVPVHGAEPPADSGVHPDGILPGLQHLSSHGCSTQADTHRREGGQQCEGKPGWARGGRAAPGNRAQGARICPGCPSLPGCSHWCCIPTWAGFDEHAPPPRRLLQPAGVAVGCAVHGAHLQIEAADLVEEQILEQPLVLAKL